LHEGNIVFADAHEFDDIAHIVNGKRYQSIDGRAGRAAALQQRRAAFEDGCGPPQPIPTTPPSKKFAP
jgi:hypothetical protein